MAEGLQQTAELVHDMADGMERGHKSAQGMEISIARMATSLVAARGFEAVFDRLVMKSDTMLKVQKAFTKENLTQAGFTNKYIAAYTAVAALLGDLFHKQRQFNQDLIEANSTFEHRNKLLKDTLVTQAQTGVSFDKVTNAARALVSYGLDMETSFEANLEIVAKMEQGLGVNASESARLASIVERQVKTSFDGVARTIAQIVEDTALAGDEAARLATNISTALGRLRPGLGAAGLPDVLKLVGRYEGALKEVGGSSGALTQLLTQLTTPEGIVGAGTLGVNPDFLATSQGVQDVMTRFSKYGEMLVGQSNGWERQMRLQALAQQFNLSADQANQLLIAIKRGNEQQMGAITLQDRWKQQLNATNSGIARLTASLWGLLQGGLLPIVNIVGFLANKLADVVEGLLKYKTVVTVAGYAVLAGVGLLTIQLWSLTRALYAVATGAVTATLSLGRQAVAQQLEFGFMSSMKSTGGVSALVRPLSLIGRGISLLLSPLGVLVGVAIAAGAILNKIYNINKESHDQQQQAQRIALTGYQNLAEKRQSQLYAAARYGDAEDVFHAYERLASLSTAMFEDITDPIQRGISTQAWLNEIINKSQLDTLKGMTTRGMYTPLEEMTPDDERREDEMRDLTQKMLKVNERQEVLAARDIQMKLEQQQEQAVLDFKRSLSSPWAWNPFINDPLGISNFGGR